MFYFPARRLRAPTADGAALIEPPCEAIPALLAANRARLPAGGGQGGLPLDRLREEGRAELRAAALAYTRAYRDASVPAAADREAPFLLSGHQPELFHPGVWLKNYLLDAAGRQLAAVPINLIVDTDTVRTTAIRVPVQGGDQAAVEPVLFDQPGPAVPFEERSIAAPALLRSFAERVEATLRTALAGAAYEPLVRRWGELLPAAAVQAAAPLPLGLALAQARHRLEGELGLQTLELPLSRVAASSTFRRFAAGLLEDLPRLRAVYNGALDAYRVANHIRSRSHPVPSLAEQDDWLEAPLFVWTAADPRRRHLFVRRRGAELLLTDRESLHLPLAAGDGERLAEQLAAAEASGIKLRPRALVTTVFARLVLSDLFFHGIGGAKYDELTDAIVAEYFGLTPPAYVTATATFRLPIDRPQVTEEDLRAIERRLRDIRYRPESFVGDPRLVGSAADERLAALAEAKREFLRSHVLRRCPATVFAELDQLNREMAELLSPMRAELVQTRQALGALRQRGQLLASREFSFVLFPSEILPARLLDLCKTSP
jgi:hypothetical protein